MTVRPHSLDSSRSLVRSRIAHSFNRSRDLLATPSAPTSAARCRRQVHAWSAPLIAPPNHTLSPSLAFSRHTRFAFRFSFFVFVFVFFEPLSSPSRSFVWPCFSVFVSFSCCCSLQPNRLSFSLPIATYSRLLHVRFRLHHFIRSISSSSFSLELGRDPSSRDRISSHFSFYSDRATPKTTRTLFATTLSFSRFDHHHHTPRFSLLTITLSLSPYAITCSLGLFHSQFDRPLLTYPPSPVRSIEFDTKRSFSTRSTSSLAFSSKQLVAK